MILDSVKDYKILKELESYLKKIEKAHSYAIYHRVDEISLMKSLYNLLDSVSVQVRK